MRRLPGALVALALLVVAPAEALAVTGDELKNLGSGGPAAPPQMDSGAGSIGRVLLGLFLVVVVIGVLYYAMKRTQRGRQPGGRRTSGAIEVLETTPLGPGRNIHLVRVGERIIVLAASEHAIAALHTFEHDEAIDEGLIRDEATTVTADLDPALTAALGAPARPPRRSLVDAMRERTYR
jgi:flagellar biosynthetic protein FliO